MPKNISSQGTMRKHQTLQEKESRKKEEERMKRTEVRLSAPDKVRRDAAAKKYWNRYVREIRELELLDNLDADMLGSYCMILARLDRIQEMLGDGEPDMDVVTKMESTERNALAYAQKLGLTPESRARLAKRRAEELPEDPDADLWGD